MEFAYFGQARPSVSGKSIRSAWPAEVEAPPDMRPDDHIRGLADLLVAVVLREFRADPEKFAADPPGDPVIDERDDERRDAVLSR